MLSWAFESLSQHLLILFCVDIYNVWENIVVVYFYSEMIESLDFFFEKLRAENDVSEY